MLSLSMVFYVFVLFVYALVCCCHGLADFGPKVVATRGEIWPAPQRRVYFDGYYTIRPSAFKFNVTRESCDILEQAVQRYQSLLQQHNRKIRIYREIAQKKKKQSFGDNLGNLGSLEIQLMAPCEDKPYLNMDEQYELRIVDRETLPALLTSQTIWGILRGLESFAQLISPDLSYTTLVLNCTHILDYPRFSHRGLLIDTARHYIPVTMLKTMLDGLVMNKMNVFHWHIVDDQSFPFRSQTFPELSERGAYDPKTHIYKVEDVQEIVEYARVRGIRVIPEFDVPGHTRSWGQAFPGLLTECYTFDEPNGQLGPMNPIEPSVYKFILQLFKEVRTLFPDNFFHIGGDEVPFECWLSNPVLLRYMKEHSTSPEKLEGLFVDKTIAIVRNLSATPIVWQEVFDNGARPSESVIFHIWKGMHELELSRVTKEGYQVLLSSPWYLDQLSSGGDWTKFYQADPQRFPGTQTQKDLVIGGEACMWSEVVDVNNLSSRIWPRASAVAEKLWSSVLSTSNTTFAATRLEEHVCRMNRRNVPAQPANGPGFCRLANF